MSGASLSVPGVLHVGAPTEQELAVLHMGPGVGWVALKGIHTWSREVSVVLKADVTEALCRELGVTLPEARPEAATLQNAQRAAQASNLVAVDSSLVDKLVAHGVRVHTIGSDRITGGFYYFAKGGSGEAVRLQGNLVEMVASTLAASADNAAVEACLDGVIPRLLTELSGGGALRGTDRARRDAAGAGRARVRGGGEAADARGVPGPHRDSRVEVRRAGACGRGGARAGDGPGRTRACGPAVRGCPSRCATGAGDRVRRGRVGSSAEVDASGAGSLVGGGRHVGNDPAARGRTEGRG